MVTIAGKPSGTAAIARLHRGHEQVDDVLLFGLEIVKEAAAQRLAQMGVAPGWQ